MLLSAYPSVSEILNDIETPMYKETYYCPIYKIKIRFIRDNRKSKRTKYYYKKFIKRTKNT